MKQQLTTLLLGEVPQSLRGKVFQIPAAKNAPHYFQTSVPHQIILDQEKIAIDGKEITFHIKGYPTDILLIQASLEVKNIFHKDTIDLEEKIYDHCYATLKKRGGNKELSEIYSVFSISGYSGAPEQFLKHGAMITSLLKSERLELDPKEIEYTLSTQIKYEKNDMAILDWDGACLFDQDGDFEPTIELLTLANLQLLRHRILDKQLDERLARAARLVKRYETKSFVIRRKELRNDLKEIIKTRMASLTAFQGIERDIKLIGDWYSARLYDTTAKKLKIDGWRTSIKDKLGSLEEVYSIVVENFSVSSKDRAEWIQIVAFFILQVGWFVLLVLEFFYFTR